LQLAQSALVDGGQLSTDVIDIRSQLNATDANIDDVSTGINDTMETINELLTSAQAVQSNITMATSDVVDLSALSELLTQLEANATSVDSQVQFLTCTRSSVSFP